MKGERQSWPGRRKAPSAPIVVGLVVAFVTAGAVSWATPDGNLVVTLVPAVVLGLASSGIARSVAMKVLTTILLAGAIAGALDITYAFIVYGPISYGMSPTDVLHSVASGWLGRQAANTGGTGTALLGLATHFGIAILMAAAYVSLATSWPALMRHAVASGLAYGFLLYLAMTYVVVPLSATHESQHFAASVGEAGERLRRSFSTIRPSDRWQLAGTLFTHMVFVGLAIAVVARRRARVP